MTDHDNDNPQAAPETTPDAYTQKASSNPKFKEVPKTGQGFVFVGAKP